MCPKPCDRFCSQRARFVERVKTMWRRLLVVILCFSFSSVAFAHLCNDVFVQAKDNLAVKVDIRDGQLRIGKEASFRVYLLNTMDRNIDEIRLRVKSRHFDAEVAPSPQWRTRPALKAVKRGGKKEYVTVTLRRKPGVPDGRYKIGLDLYSKRQRRTFKTVDLDTAADINDLPKAVGINIDGRADRREWGKAYLCTSFHCYRKEKRYMKNYPARDQSRFRVSYDDDYLYCLLGFQGGEGAQADQVSLYAAGSTDAEPVVITFDRGSGRAAGAGGTAGVECRKTPDGNRIECRIPRTLLGIQGLNNFHLNFTRVVTRGNKKEISYWRGNAYSVQDPMVYGQFRIAR